MTREEAITILKDISWQMGSVKRWENIEAIDMAIEALSAEPNKAVPPSLADVYKWERDIALSQLEEYGICFGEKKRDDLLEVVRCKNCIHGWFGEMLKGADGFDRMCKWYGIGVNNNHYCSHGERVTK